MNNLELAARMTPQFLVAIETSHWLDFSLTQLEFLVRRIVEELASTNDGLKTQFNNDRGSYMPNLRNRNRIE